MMKRSFQQSSFSEPTAGYIAISSSTGDTYHVWQFGTAYECECVQFRALRKHCKHIAALKVAVKTGKSAGLRLFFNNGEDK
jgi:predicted nucleic acid-binding Zn finger protein